MTRAKTKKKGPTVEATITLEFLTDGTVDVTIDNFERLTVRRMERAFVAVNRAWQQLRAQAIGELRVKQAAASQNVETQEVTNA